jgi:hypothetical protein
MKTRAAHTLILPLTATLFLLLATSAAAQNHTLADFPTDEAYIRYLGNEPASFAADWTNDYNGVTHDDDHWYFASVDMIFRIHVGARLDRDMDIPGVPRVSLQQHPETSDYNHLGDISWYRHDGQGYVLAPLDQGPPGAAPLLAIYRGNDSLDLVHVIEFPGQLNGSGNGSAAFAAVDSLGRIYSVGRGRCSTANGGDAVACLRRYEIADTSGNPVGWDAVGSVAVDGLRLVLDAEVPLRDAQGGQILLRGWQGAVVAPSDRVIYITNGWNCDSDNLGLHAFDLETGRELARSGMTRESLFRFQFNCQSVGDTAGLQEPEGLTIWDLDGVHNSYHDLRGQLHVLMLDNDLHGNDHAYFKHYTNRLFVDPSRSSGNGRIGSPYGSLDEAFVQRSCVPPLYGDNPPPCIERPAPWSGSSLVLAPGDYDDALSGPDMEGHPITVLGNGTANFGN